MGNFLLISGLKPTSTFCGCLPLRIGMIVLTIIQFAFLVADLFESIYVFNKQVTINQWIAFAVQLSLSNFMLVNFVTRHKNLGYFTYIALIITTGLVAAEKVFKTKDFYNLAVLYWKLENSNTIGLAVIFACRCGFEFFFYFYTTYIAYSYAKKSKPELLEEKK
jgi:hypothetical protein